MRGAAEAPDTCAPPARSQRGAALVVPDRRQLTFDAVDALVLHAPAGPWAGESVEVLVDRGYIAMAVGVGDSEVLSQVAFRASDLADMQPGTVYNNDSDPDVPELIGRSTEDFTADVCNRG